MREAKFIAWDRDWNFLGKCYAVRVDGEYRIPAGYLDRVPTARYGTFDDADYGRTAVAIERRER